MYYYLRCFLVGYNRDLYEILMEYLGEKRMNWRKMSIGIFYFHFSNMRENKMCGKMCCRHSLCKSGPFCEPNRTNLWKRRPLRTFSQFLLDFTHFPPLFWIHSCSLKMKLPIIWCVKWMENETFLIPPNIRCSIAPN